MKEYECDYTWDEVKDSVNRCLRVIYEEEGDLVKDIFNDNLPQAMNKVARQSFIRGRHLYSFYDLRLIKQAFCQLDKVGYIGSKDVINRVPDRLV